MLEKHIREFIKCVDVLGDVGEANTSLEWMTLREISVDPKIGPTLGENLAIFFPPDEIIRIRLLAKTKPEIMDSVRETDDGSGTNQAAGPCQCRDCQEKKDKEDR